ncbi:MAG: GDSL-type esterase/lipase family protein [Planctomycetaceae bacterium]
MRFALVACLTLFCTAIVNGAEPAGAVTTPEGRKLSFDPDWTPRPQEGDVFPWVKETDVDWVDDRLRKMDTGRTFNGTFKYKHNGKDVTCYKGTAIRVGEHGEAAWLYDRNQLRWCCAWECEPLAEPSADNPTGFTPYLNHSDRRFGLLNTPTPKGNIVASTAAGGMWSSDLNRWPEAGAVTTSLPSRQGRHAGLIRSGIRTIVATEFDNPGTPDNPDVIYELPWVAEVAGEKVMTRTIKYPGGTPHEVRLIGSDHQRWTPRAFAAAMNDHGRTSVLLLDKGPESMCVTIHVPRESLDEVQVKNNVAGASNDLSLVFSGGDATAFVCYFQVQGKTTEQLDDIGERSCTLAGELGMAATLEAWLDTPCVDDERTLDTAGQKKADEAAYVVDTLTLPYDNPYRALFFASAVEFIPRVWASGWATGAGPDLAVLATVHGDVWLVDGVDADLKQLRWKRFATGLYQPLGMKVVEDDLIVLERGQLTRLHDHNHDGVADEYRCLCGDWHIGGGEHSYHTSLETDNDGSFYFHAGGDTNTPTGGTLVKVSKDPQHPGQYRSEVFSTGFRHPIGLGSLPDGRITGADQEGNWMPSTRLDIYKRGGFYGDMRAHHRPVEPTTYDEPLCWIPRQVDGSAGGEVYVNRDDFGPLSRQLLHMSFGNCSLMLVLMQQIDGIEQAGVFDLGLKFLAGIQRGRFRNSDGCLYLAGMDGWQTAAQADGCLQRVRYTGKPISLPVGLAIENGDIQLRFNVPVSRDFGDLADGGTAADPRRYNVEIWNYLWSKEYGSKRYSVEHPGEVGQDKLKVESAIVLDPWTVSLRVPDLQPCMQTQIEFDLLAYADDAKAPDGERFKGTIYSTVHSLGRMPEFEAEERIALIGGTLVEREQRYGYWEHAITTAYPEKQLTFRNLGWSGDTVWAESRGIFDPADKGYARMQEQVRELRPTTFVLNYGGNEAWESLQSGEPVEAAINKFIAQYGKLMDDLKVAAAGSEGDGAIGQPPQFVLLTPLPLEVGVGPNSHPEQYNEHLAKYTAAIEALASERALPCIKLSDLYDWYTDQTAIEAVRRPLTDNGQHLSAYGYWRTADWIRQRLCANTARPSLIMPTAEGALSARAKLNPESGRIRIGPTPMAELGPNQVCLKFSGQFTTLPQPPLGNEPGLTALQRYEITEPGAYELQEDGQPVAQGGPMQWDQGLPIAAGPDVTQSTELLHKIRRKNELYFHRWRPQNVTYLFLFRKHEQGNNAVEIPQFDPLIAAEEAHIAKLRQPQGHQFSLIRTGNR